MENKKGIADPQEGKKIVSHRIDQLHIADTEDPNIKSNIDIRALEAFQAVKMSNSKNITFHNVTVSRRFDEPDCFILCTSKICSKETMSQFEGADSCVEVVEIESFYRVLTDTYYHRPKRRPKSPDKKRPLIEQDALRHLNAYFMKRLSYPCPVLQ